MNKVKEHTDDILDDLDDEDIFEDDDMDHGWSAEDVKDVAEDVKEDLKDAAETAKDGAAETAKDVKDAVEKAWNRYLRTWKQEWKTQKSHGKQQFWEYRENRITQTPGDLYKPNPGGLSLFYSWPASRFSNICRL